MSPHSDFSPGGPAALGTQQRGGGGTPPLFLSVEILLFLCGICSVLDAGCLWGGVTFEVTRVVAV